ncbi:MAG: relaxase/mobilization nuclease domain-containing protein [Pseudomonadota bacterium]
MIPRINQGRSFKGVTAYLMHDKKAQTSERVAWTETGNLYTNDVHKAAKVMAWTDIHADELKHASGGSTAGRKAEAGAVYHYSLSWAREENPDKAHMRETAQSTLEKLGLHEHQYYVVAHDDTKHAHVHVVANLVHPTTGKRAELGLDKRKLQDFALQYELTHGLHCEMRLQNAEQRQQQDAKEYYPSKTEQYQAKITRAYETSDDGKSFKAAIEQEGLTLAKGRKSIVAVDSKGEILNLARMIEGHKTKEIKAKLKNLENHQLQDADILSEHLKAQSQQVSYDRESDEIKRQKALEEAAHKTAKEKVQVEQAETKIKREALLAREKKRIRIEKAAIAKRYQLKLDEKVEGSKKRHQVAFFEKKLKEAQIERENVNRFWVRWFNRKRYHAALDDLQNREKQLRDARVRCRSDVEAYIEKRPKWAQEKELERLGFEGRKPKKAEETRLDKNVFQNSNMPVKTDTKDNKPFEHGEQGKAKKITHEWVNTQSHEADMTASEYDRLLNRKPIEQFHSSEPARDKNASHDNYRQLKR